MLFTSTVAAISTPPGKGGVAVIRISGADAIGIANKIFLPKGKRSIKDFPRVQMYGDILYQGEPIDDGLITYFNAPNSYTGEDVIEISCHGGMLISKKVLESALIAGASPAERGEFTKRAFVNGKLSLTETEAISMLLEAESDAQIKLSREKSRSKLKGAVNEIREALVSLLSSVYARIDYPEEDLGELSSEEILESLSVIYERLEALASTYKTGRAVSEGINTVICGKPNVGKSTLYNLLVGENAAIVTDIPGTTRDVLEKSVPLGDVMLRLYDTAGIRGGRVDAVEAIGIERSREKIDTAELVFALFDSSRPLDKADLEILDFIKTSPAVKLALITKCDGEGALTGGSENFADSIKHELQGYDFSGVLTISAKEKKESSLKAVTGLVGELFTDEKISIGDDAIISSARQNSAVLRAMEFISCAKSAFLLGLPDDAASSDIELALGAISELDGRSVTEEVVEDIFAKFCVGK